MTLSRTWMTVGGLMLTAAIAPAQPAPPAPAAPSAMRAARAPEAPPTPAPAIAAYLEAPAAPPALEPANAAEFELTPAPPAPPALAVLADPETPPVPPAAPTPRPRAMVAPAAPLFQLTPAAAPPAPPATPRPRVMVAPGTPFQLAYPAGTPIAINDQDFPELAAKAKQLADEAKKFQYMDGSYKDSAEYQDFVARAKELGDEAREQAKIAVEKFKFDSKFDMNFDYNFDFKTNFNGFGDQMAAAKIAAATPSVLKGPFAFQIGRGARGNEDQLYSQGQRALDSHHWDEALGDFNQIISRSGARADAALYWKAYSLKKLNKFDEGLAAIAELRRSHSNSRWLDDAKALEVELNQAKGKPVSPEQESDEELKLMAIHGLMQSDPDRALPLLENILKSSQSPKVKEQALIVLSMSSVPKAQQVLEQVARGGSNPDLQVKAINQLATTRRREQSSNRNLLAEIYAASSDFSVKRAIISAYTSSRDYEHLAQVAKSEKEQELRYRAFEQLGQVTGQPELWQIWPSETAPEAKRTILDNLSNQRNAKALVDLARAEKDPQMKLRIVERLSNMRNSKEATDYLMEILSK